MLLSHIQDHTDERSQFHSARSFLVVPNQVLAEVDVPQRRERASELALVATASLLR